MHFFSSGGVSVLAVSSVANKKRPIEIVLAISSANFFLVINKVIRRRALGGSSHVYGFPGDPPSENSKGRGFLAALPAGASSENFMGRGCLEALPTGAEALPAGASGLELKGGASWRPFHKALLDGSLVCSGWLWLARWEFGLF